MASIFANNRILPNLKRRARPTNKSDNSPSKSKPLHILPNVAEEDESPSRESCSSLSSLPTIPSPSYRHSPYVAASATLGARPTHDKRDSRRVVLTGVEGITFDDFFPLSSAPRARTPSPPRRPITPPPRSVTSSPAAESPLDDINLRFSGLGISLDFPSPPATTTRIPSLSRKREQSPSPSVTSSEASTCSPKTPCSTPPTSDDDESPRKASNLMRAPTFKSQRASVLFVQPMHELAEPVRKASITSLLDDDVSEEVAWIAQDISEFVTLASPLPPAFPVEASSQSESRARPDSVLPPPRKPSRANKPSLPRISIQDSSARGPSAQLDPTFPLKRRSYLVPSRPPPPPPVSVPVPTSPKSPVSAMERATEELLAELANAALGAGFRGTGLAVPHAQVDALSISGSVPPSPSSQFIVTTPVTPPPSSALRPPPRSSVPADILLDYCDCDSPVDTPASGSGQRWPTTPMSAATTTATASVYSQTTDSAPVSPLSSFDFDVSGVRPATPSSPAVPRRMPSTRSVGSGSDPERALRSRWSTSTLGSVADAHAHGWRGIFTLSPSKRGKGPSKHSHAHSNGHGNGNGNGYAAHLQRKNAVKSSHAPKRSMDSGVSRRDSRSSRVSESSASDSGESAASSGSGSGLRRKPIPLTLLSVGGPANSMQM
ncbi:hypothetical protein GSI_12371 [Ganoderma sinense ZZ0214-1]|uniref:Uncharacterized protein n=1 Tax=Ganoderma sinense ZZ0214-1 TaxID=1077348 RepID=A0A2G8RVM9_9APHY|nr:hypothetical protein GSI_12371 [Ganoderma sinense ZZ0214-1]